MRLFVGFDLPPSAKAALGRAVEPLRANLPKARWVKPDLLHLTLAFVGEQAGADLPRIGQRLKEKLEQRDAFLGRFGGLGAFPPAGKVRVVWVGLEPVEKFERLAADVREGLSEAGVAFDAKPFRSHVTLARCDPPWPAGARDAIAKADPSFSELFSRSAIECKVVTLFSSVLGSSGPTYRKEIELPLEDSPGSKQTSEAFT